MEVKGEKPPHGSLKAKSFLTVAETADWISRVTGESMTPRDVLQLAVARRLPLALLLMQPVDAFLCLREKHYTLNPALDDPDYEPAHGEAIDMGLTDWDDGLTYVYYNNHRKMTGLWDLKVPADVDLSSFEQGARWGQITLTSQNLSDWRKEMWFLTWDDQVVNVGHYDMAIRSLSRVPEAEVVIMASAVNEFLMALDEPDVSESGEKPIASRERKSLLRIIGAMQSLLVQHEDGDGKEPFVSRARLIAAIQASFPSKEGLSERNLEAKLKQAADLIKAL